MYTAMEIAYWFIFQNFLKQRENIATNEDYETYDGITHFKLQSLLYNAQGCNLAMNDEPLFDDSIEKWENSPMIESVYDVFSVFRQNTIIMPYTKEADCAVSKINKDSKARNVLEFVYNNFNIYTAWELKKTATEVNTPWEKTQMDKVIDLNLIKEYFKTEVLEE